MKIKYRDYNLKKEHLNENNKIFSNYAIFVGLAYLSLVKVLRKIIALFNF